MTKQDWDNERADLDRDTTSARVYLKQAGDNGRECEALMAVFLEHTYVQGPLVQEVEKLLKDQRKLNDRLGRALGKLHLWIANDE